MIVYIILLLAILIIGYVVSTKSYRALEKKGSKYAFLISSLAGLATLAILLAISFIIMIATVRFEQ